MICLYKSISNHDKKFSHKNRKIKLTGTTEEIETNSLMSCEYLL